MVGQLNRVLRAIKIGVLLVLSYFGWLAVMKINKLGHVTIVLDGVAV